MFIETVDQFAKTAVAKADFLRRSLVGFTISSIMAGAYVGLGIMGVGYWAASRTPAPVPATASLAAAE